MAKAKEPVWVSVKDGLPEAGERVLATDGVFVGEAFTRSGDWMRYVGIAWKELSPTRVTHWMPMPEPPEEKRMKKSRREP